VEDRLDPHRPHPRRGVKSGTEAESGQFRLPRGAAHSQASSRWAPATMLADMRAHGVTVDVRETTAMTSEAVKTLPSRVRMLPPIVSALTHRAVGESAYKGALLFGGKRRFVLSKSGHIQALVNPPSPKSRSSYQVANELPEEPETFFAQAPKLPGSWWPDWDAWLAGRSGELGPAPKSLGNGAHKAKAKAPGTYVLAD
jgi:hypothetical protein